MCGKEVICASYRSMLDVKLNSQMFGEERHFVHCYKKIGNICGQNDFCLIVAQNNFHFIPREKRCLAKSVKGRKSQVFNIFE
jgi:hypothetical protein